MASAVRLGKVQFNANNKIYLREESIIPSSSWTVMMAVSLAPSHIINQNHLTKGEGSGHINIYITSSSLIRFHYM